MNIDEVTTYLLNRNDYSKDERKEIRQKILETTEDRHFRITYDL